jgi:diacylglycerol kinase family enzyme
LLVVLNPSSFGPRTAALSAAALAELERRFGAACERLETRGDGADTGRIAAELRGGRHRLVVAGGGDGTVRDVVQALMESATSDRVALALLPLGTANNVARALGLLSFRGGGTRAVDRFLRAVGGGRERRIDVGRSGDEYFAGSLAVGMDADILATRNRLRRRLRLGKRLGGYPLYLWSCAANALRRHGARAALRIDAAAGEPETSANASFYNLLVTNTPIYAGEFRFDDGDRWDDGLLDLYVFGGAADYLSRYPAAWRRHVKRARGRAVTPTHGGQRFHRLDVELDAAVAWQLDGEERRPARWLRVEVVPAAVAVRVP